MLVPGFKTRITSGLENDKNIHSIGLILHLAVSNAPSLYPQFSGPSKGIESTLWAVRRSDKSNGENEQYRPVGREADANLKANSFYRHGRWLGFTSLETQGTDEHGTWTDYQLDAIKRVFRWGHGEWGWKYRVCPGAFSSGLGYHTMWGAPSQWTPVAKTCPGSGRIEQFHDVLVPWLRVMHKESNPPQAIVAGPKDTWASLAGRADVSPLALYRANNRMVQVEEGRHYKLPEGV